MTLLNGVLALHDCRDVERLCRRALADRGATTWQRQDHDNCLAFLITRTWELSRTYDPQLDQHPSFASYTYYRLYHHIITDWIRQEFGDHRRNQPSVLLYGHPDTVDALGDRVEPLHPSSSHNDGRPDDLQRLVEEGHRNQTRYIHVIRRTLLERAAQRARTQQRPLAEREAA